MLLGAMLIVSLPAPVLAACKLDEQPPKDGALIKRALERRYQLLINKHERQERMIEKANGFSEKARSRISKLALEGKDTSALEEALGRLESAISQASELSEKASVLLDAHPGFDSQGKVTDVEQAQETIYEADNLLFDSKELIEHALRDFRDAIREFRQANKPKSETAGIT